MVGQRLLAGVKDDFYDLVHSLNSWRFWQTVIAMAVGLMLFSIGINGILVPQKFLASGATGIALLLFYMLGKPSVGVIYWALNVPILILGWRAMSLKFVVMALMGVFLSGFAMTVTHDVRLPVHEPLMAAIIAGCITGAGVGLYLRFGGSAGGVDIVAAVLRRKYGIPMGTTFISVNAVTFVASGLINHSVELAFYTAVAMTVHSRVVERMQSGFSGRKAALIVTGQPDEIATQIMRRLNRGVTFLHGSGGMSKRETRVVYTVVNMVELARLKDIIFHCDPRAFIAVSDASEVIGYRFVSWADQGFEAKARAKAAAEAAFDALPELPGFGRHATETAAGTVSRAPRPPSDG